MSIQDEIKSARQKIIKDGFDMSIGELIRIYEKDELIINPAYQRSFRWDDSRKTRFIESLILGIPIPPIFVYTNEDGRWELIDGLQRLSTIFQFAGVLKKPGTTELEPQFKPSGTKLLPSLNNIAWEVENDTNEDNNLPLSIRLDIERVRLRVEILKRESDNRAKYELFQRLNSGGAELSPQESRNCVASMLNPQLLGKMLSMSEHPAFKGTISLTERAFEEQKHVELVLRFLAFRYKPYTSGVDVHDWLDEILIDISQDPNFDINSEQEVFEQLFTKLNEYLGANSFKRYEGGFGGSFSISAFEAITYGVSKNMPDAICQDKRDALIQAIKDMWSRQEFVDSTRAGTRGSTRIAKLLPLAQQWFDI